MSKKQLVATVTTTDLSDMVALMNKVNAADQIGDIAYSMFHLAPPQAQEFLRILLGKIGELVQFGSKVIEDKWKEYAETYNLDYKFEEDTLSIVSSTCQIKVKKGSKVNADSTPTATVEPLDTLAK